MDVNITLERRHAALTALFISVLLCVLLVRGFGGTNPAIVGHSALELIVNGSSVVDDSLTGADIDESTLVIGGGSSLANAVIIITPGNETTIQNAITNLSTLGGGTVYMREGTYTIAGPINMTSNIALVGEGSATILQATTNGIDMITETSASLLENVRLKDFAMTSGASTGIDGVVFSTVSGLIEGLNITNMQGNSIQIVNIVAAGANPAMHVQRNRIVSTGGLDGISIIGTTIGTAPVEQLVNGNIIEGTFSDAGINASTLVQVRDNTLSVTSMGINASNDVIVQGNKVRSTVSAGANRAGIVVSVNAQAMDNFVAVVGTAPAIEAFNGATVSGNQVSSTAGIGIELNSDAVAIGNRVSSAGLEGISYSTAGGTGTITGNQVNSWSTAAGVHAGIEVTGGEVAVSSNTVEGASIGPGINITGGNIIQVIGNYVSTGSHTAIAMSSSGTIGDNTVSTASTTDAIFSDANDLTITGNYMLSGGLNTTGSQLTITGNLLNTGNVRIAGNLGTISGNQFQGDVNATGQQVIVMTGNHITGDLDMNGAVANKAATGNIVQGDLYITSSAECTLTGNVVSGTYFVGACSAGNNV